jgi:hypothetical protein
MNDCKADLGTNCDCESCEANRRYWASYFAGFHIETYSENELRDCYSDPTDRAKLERMLS